MAGLLEVHSTFLSQLPEGPGKRIVMILLATLPLALFMGVYQRYAYKRLRWYEVPFYALHFSLYSYMWVMASARAWSRILSRRNQWVKTPREVVVEELPVS